MGPLPQPRIPRPVMRRVVRSAVRPVLSPRVPVARQRQALEALARLRVLPSGTSIERITLGGRPAERVTVGSPTRALTVLYLHGGGYTVGSLGSHRALVAHLAAATGGTVIALDYRLAPEHVFPAALYDALAAYQELLASGVDASDLVIAGDSAGGGLAVATALRLRELGVPLPTALGLISPWVDLNLSGVRDSRRDPMLRRRWLRATGESYAGNVVTSHPTLSPINADLEGLPRMVVHASSDEILLPSIEAFVSAAEAAAVPVDHTVLPDAWHVIHLHAGLVRASDDAVRRLAEALLAP